MNNNTTFIIIMVICGILVAYIVIKNVKIDDFADTLPLLQLPAISDPSQGITIDNAIPTPSQGITIDNSIPTPSQGITIDNSIPTPSKGITIDNAIPTPSQGATDNAIPTPSQVPIQSPMPSLFPADAPTLMPTAPPIQMPMPQISLSELIWRWGDASQVGSTSEGERDSIISDLLEYMQQCDKADLGTCFTLNQDYGLELTNALQKYITYKQRLSDEDANARQAYSDVIQSLGQQIAKENVKLAEVENFMGNYKNIAYITHIAAYVEDSSIADNMADFRMFRT